MTTRIARTQKRWNEALNSIPDDAEQQRATRRSKFAAMVQSPDETLNSQKEPVPKASPEQTNVEASESAALLRLAGGDRELAIVLKKAIEKQAAERYASAVALDTAMNALIRKRDGQLEKLTPEYVKMRQGIKCTPELLEWMLEQVADGISIYRLCKRDDMPTSQSVTIAMNSPEWVTKYHSALLRRTDKHVDEIADASRELAVAVASGADANMVNAIKIHINTLQWIAARINPAKYGDRQTVDMNANVKLTEPQVDDRLKALLTKAGLDAAALNSAPDPDKADSDA